ncbi:NAD(P)H-binding protein [Streptomyces sp. BHT-5-2]|uniref:SDR family oxidoreductase n=1 Tax=Streptomyces sp. BHT-5-2 TaxID=2866715 RepID=UPI001C8E889A|nr:NAD(P)H-binding protein [Streptomyces sp. BHT-5-2]QZL03422.1 NAD(P)H-binding protein [Streptomyces sp. BHT-5-2]
MKILVTGATGNVGRLVTEGLLDAGVDVRALTRNPAAAGLPAGAEVVAGDLSEPDTLRKALDGVERMYLFPIPQAVREVVGAAERAGVRRVVTLSSGAVTAGFDTTHHLPVEQAVEASGMEWTHVRPGEFATNKVALWGPSIREERVVRHPNLDVVWFPVHERDIADVAVLALLGDGHHGAAYTVNGPPVSLRDQVRAIAEALGEEIRCERVTPEEARERYVRQGGFAAVAADFLLGFVDHAGNPADPHAPAAFDASALGPQPTVREVTGAAPRTFAQWARDHVADFR